MVTTSKKIILLLPFLAIGAFIVLYILAAYYYPGGNDADKSQIGFDILQNYWCDLLGGQAKNGAPNPSRPIAIVAMIILFSGLAVFWYHVPDLFSGNQSSNRIIRWCGVISMLTATLLFTPFHDPVINIAGAFGVISFVTTFIALYRYQYINVLALGIIALLMCFINYIIYFSGNFIFLLPVFQKIAFLICLIWISIFNHKLYTLANKQTQ